MSDLSHCVAYIEQQHVLTLCCHDQQDSWAANCFYLFDAGTISFWLMTEPDTRHGRLMSTCPQVVGTISDQCPSVEQLKGVQFSGEIFHLSGVVAEKALSRYQARFLVANHKLALLWQLRVDQLKMTDNTLGFGTKIHWQRQ